MASTSYTIKYGWRDYKASYYLLCGCGKKMRRRLTNGCNEMADVDYRKNLVDNLERDAKALDGGAETCLECLNATIGPISFQPLEPGIITEACDILVQIRDLKRKLSDFGQRFEGKICCQGNEEYLCTGSISDDYLAPLIHCCKINKKKPWEITDKQEWFNLSSLEFSTATLDSRRNAVKAA